MCVRRLYVVCGMYVCGVCICGGVWCVDMCVARVYVCVYVYVCVGCVCGVCVSMCWGWEGRHPDPASWMRRQAF